MPCGRSQSLRAEPISKQVAKHCSRVADKPRIIDRHTFGRSSEPIRKAMDDCQNLI
jgi:hypothetical protein